MEKVVESLEKAYHSLLASAACVFESNELSDGSKTASADAALETFKQQWQVFKVSCDQAEEFIESLKHRIGSECLIDEATGSKPQRPLTQATPQAPFPVNLAKTTERKSQPSDSVPPGSADMAISEQVALSLE